MSDAFIVRRGGDSSIGNAFAVISVTYPEGSVCTCANGNKVLKAKDTSGQALFLVPCAGVWVISIALGTAVDSKSVEIISYGQLENINFILPSEYQRVEYIQSSGTQYISVPELPTANSELIWDIYYTLGTYSKKIWIGIFGGPTTFGCMINNDSGNAAMVGLGNTYDSGMNTNGMKVPLTTGRHRLTYSFIDKFVSVDDTKKEVPFNGTINFNNTVVNMGLGIIGITYFSWSGIQKPGITTLGEFIWKENGAEHMHMIPCYRISDKVAGMYDLVNDVFHTNKGTGTFVVGGDVQ